MCAWLLWYLCVPPFPCLFPWVIPCPDDEPGWGDLAPPPPSKSRKMSRISCEEEKDNPQSTNRHQILFVHRSRPHLVPVLPGELVGRPRVVQPGPLQAEVGAPLQEETDSLGLVAPD